MKTKGFLLIVLAVIVVSCAAPTAPTPTTSGKTYPPKRGTVLLMTGDGAFAVTMWNSHIPIGAVKLDDIMRGEAIIPSKLAKASLSVDKSTIDLVPRSGVSIRLSFVSDNWYRVESESNNTFGSRMQVEDGKVYRFEWEGNTNCYLLHNADGSWLLACDP